MYFGKEEEKLMAELKISSDLQNLIKNIVRDTYYPIGKMYITMGNEDPNETIGGTWELTASGKVLVGVDPSDVDFNTVGKTGGEKKHQLKIEEMPSHNHLLCGSPADSADWIEGVQRVKYDVNKKTASNTYTLAQPVFNTGGSQAHNNVQPYVAVYMWKRIA